MKQTATFPVSAFTTPLVKYRHTTLAESSWRQIEKQILLWPHKRTSRPKTGNVCMYKGCLHDKEAMTRLEFHVGGLFPKISKISFLSLLPFLHFRPLSL